MKDRKNILKTVGVILLIVGLALTAFGVYDYITALVEKSRLNIFGARAWDCPFWVWGLALPFSQAKRNRPRSKTTKIKKIQPIKQPLPKHKRLTKALFLLINHPCCARYNASGRRRAQDCKRD